MFKKYFLISILLVTPSLSYAQSFPSRPSDGFWNDAIIESLKQKIDTDRINQNNGVAGLDNDGNINPNSVETKNPNKTLADIKKENHKKGDIIWCSDCTANVRTYGDDDTGIYITYDGKRWNDQMGMSVE